jgi:hypothetical protein
MIESFTPATIRIGTALSRIRSTTTRQPEAHVGAKAQSLGGECGSFLWSLALCSCFNAIGFPLEVASPKSCSNNQTAWLLQFSR